MDLPVLFITCGHVRDRDRSRLGSTARWQHVTLVNYEVPWELKRVSLDWWEEKSPIFRWKWNNNAGNSDISILTNLLLWTLTQTCMFIPSQHTQISWTCNILELENLLTFIGHMIDRYTTVQQSMCCFHKGGSDGNPSFCSEFLGLL